MGISYYCRWPAKRKRALLGSSPPRNSRLETHSVAVSGGAPRGQELSDLDDRREDRRRDTRRGLTPSDRRAPAPTMHKSHFSSVGLDRRESVITQIDSTARIASSK
jgi:hypothetical protein